MVRWLLVLIMVPLCHGVAYAELYKCVSPTGKVAYQAVPCSNGASETTVQLKQGPSQEKIEEARRINQTIQTAGSQYNPPPGIKPEASAATRSRENCTELVALYEAEKKQIVDSCRIRREDYCDNPAQTIVEVQDSRWLNGASEQQFRNFNRKHVDPPIKVLESRLVAAHCRYKK